MKKLALFVEGQTEQIFAQRLIEAIAGQHQLTVELIRATGGNRKPRRMLPLSLVGPKDARYYVLICDSSGDSSVLSDVRDQYATLVRGGYHGVLGLRDVYPQSVSAAPSMQAAMQPFVPVGAIPADILLAIAEIEAWFVAEQTHYERLDARLTEAEVIAVLGARPVDLSVEALPWPSDTLRRIYQRVGLTYAKDRHRVERTVGALDMAALYLQVAQRVPALARLCQAIDRFLS